MTITQRRSPVAEQVHNLMDTFLIARQEVPEHSSIFLIGLRIALLGVDERGELDTVSDEEHWCVVAYHIPIALLSVELDGEAAGIASRVCGAFLAAYGGEADGDFGLLADFAEEVGIGLRRISSLAMQEIVDRD